MTYRQCLHKFAGSRTFPGDGMERIRREGKSDAMKGALYAFIRHFKDPDSWADWGRSMTRGAVGFDEWSADDRDKATSLHYSDGSTEANTISRKLGEFGGALLTAIALLPVKVIGM